MTIEATLERIAAALETIAKSAGSLAQAPAQLGAPEANTTTPAPTPAPEVKKGKGKKDEAAPAPAAETSAAPSPSDAAPAAAPSESKPAGIEWQSVLDKILELNKKPEAEGGGRPAVVGVIKHFGLDPATQKVPELAKLNRNSEILAHVEALLAPKAAEEVDIF